jgi:hypothetical protein
MDGTTPRPWASRAAKELGARSVPGAEWVGSAESVAAGPAVSDRLGFIRLGSLDQIGRVGRRYRSGFVHHQDGSVIEEIPDRASEGRLESQQGGEHDVDLAGLDLLDRPGIQVGRFRQLFLSESLGAPQGADAMTEVG